MRHVYSGYERHMSGLHWGVLHTNLPFFVSHLFQVAAPRLTLPRRITQSPDTSAPTPQGKKKAWYAGKQWTVSASLKSLHRT